MDKELKEVVEALSELEEDFTVPKNIRTRISNTITSLKENGDLSIRVNKALNELDEIAEDTNMQSYTRTQIWNVTSMLEKI